MKKKDLINDLRKAHFQLGHDPKVVDSVYRKDYEAWDLEGRQSFDPNILRKTNINQKGKGQHDHYDSLYKKDFVQFEMQSAELNEENLKDLRKHHFSYGNGNLPEDMQTEQRAEFLQKQVPDSDKDSAKNTREMARASVLQGLTLG